MNRKKRNGYISTGEAAKMLGVTISTVSHYFDKGILAGEKHPLTNWRSVSRTSVLDLMIKHGIKSQE